MQEVVIVTMVMRAAWPVCSYSCKWYLQLFLHNIYTTTATPTNEILYHLTVYRNAVNMQRRNSWWCCHIGFM